MQEGVFPIPRSSRNPNKVVVHPETDQSIPTGDENEREIVPESVHSHSDGDDELPVVRVTSSLSQRSSKTGETALRKQKSKS